MVTITEDVTFQEIAIIIDLYYSEGEKKLDNYRKI